MMEVQKYLESGKTLEDLKSELGIKSRVYEEDNLVVLNYDQIESPKSHPIVVECRSLILALDDYAVVSRKFPRFFNIGECPDLHTDFKLNNSVVMEKLDGSLCGTYYNPHTNMWEISTRSLAKAEMEHATGRSWREMILEAFDFDNDQQFQNFMNSMWNPEYTYIWEFCSPENRIVVRYDKSQMVLLGVVNNETGDYAKPGSLIEIAEQFGTRSATLYQVPNTIDELKDMANKLPNLEEGFVVWDLVSGIRQKVKSLVYLELHQMRGENLIPTRKNFLSLVLTGESDEVLVYFPEWTDKVYEIQMEVNSFVSNMESVYDEHKDIQDQKEFALAIKDEPSCGVMFTARKTQEEPIHVFNQLDLSKKLKFFIK